MNESDKGTLQEPQVRAMFDRISGFYDVMNSVMTAGLHHGWRRRAGDLPAARPGGRELAGRVGPHGGVVGSDFSEGMLELARKKAPSAAAGAAPITFEWANAMALP